MQKILYPCPCARIGEFDVYHNIKRVAEEIVEFIQHPCIEEFSDVMMNLSCLLHSLNHKWIWLLPFAELSQRKGVARFNSYGCCRSIRNKVDHKEI